MIFVVLSLNPDSDPRRTVGAVGELRQALKTLTSQSESQAQTLSEIRDQIHTAKTVLWIAGIALGFIGAAGVYLLDKILDLVLKHFGG